MPVVVTGSAAERSRAEALTDACRGKAVNLAGRTSIGELAALLSLCRLFVGVDTAALHIAAAVGTPTIGIFGPTSPVSWAPRGALHRIVTKDLPCVPCRQKGCFNQEASRCMDELSFEAVRPVLDCQLGALEF
jgi:heptosyltransferase-3